MIGIAINIALLPSLSKAIKSGDKLQGEKLQNIALEASLILVIPATLALTCLAHLIIEGLFQRGAFGASETDLVAKALMFYSFGLPAYVVVKVLEPGFFARGDTKTPMKIAIVCLINNVVLNLIFFKPFGYIGIVLASICSSYLNVGLLLLNLTKRDYFAFEQKFLIKLVRIVIPAFFMAAILIFFKNYFANLLSPILNLIATIALGLISYLIASYLSGSLKIFSIIQPKTTTIKI